MNSNKKQGDEAVIRSGQKDGKDKNLIERMSECQVRERKGLGIIPKSLTLAEQRRMVSQVRFLRWRLVGKPRRDIKEQVAGYMCRDH